LLTFCQQSDNKAIFIFYGMTPYYAFLHRHLARNPLVLLLPLLCSLTTTAQTIRYVSTTGTNTNPASATSWATSTTNLQGAIDASSVSNQVWVTAGTYKPGGNGHSNRDLSFAMKNGVEIFGGFTGNETALSQRPAITISTPSGTTLSGDVGILGNPTDNSFHLFNNSSGLTNTAILNGFVITGGNAIGTSPETYGGGMYNKAAGAGQVCSPQLINCVFQNNTGTEGGAMYNNANGGGTSNPMLISCIFRNNSANSFAGAILNDGGSGGTSSLTCINCLFQNNTAPTGLGGALFNYGSAGNSSPTLINCSFLANEASQGGGMYNEGSGGTSNPQLTNCSFQNNSATTGGALYNNGSFDNNSGPLLLQKRIEDGSASKTDKGTSNPHLINCVFFGNGSANTIANNATTGSSARYSLFDPSVTGYTSVTGNLTSVSSPFASTTSSQLAICSSAVNAGDPAASSATVGSTDLVGNPRFYANTGAPAARIDMGAYELQTFPTVAITSQPAASSIGCVGGTVTTFVSVSGTALSFQWYKSGTSVGATSATLTLTNLQSGSAGAYSVAITGNCNSLTSSSFIVAVKPVPTRLYVKPSLTANANQTGLTWADAFPDLQWALNYSCSNNLAEIWVANGLYKPTSTTERTVSFAMKPNVAIYGGFLGSETALSERIITYPSGTTLSGDIGAAGTADNSYHVISNTPSLSLTNAAILDGFVVTGGNANGAFPNSAGGAMLNIGNGAGNICNPQIRHCLFIANTASSGGAIFNTGASGGDSSPTVTNCAFQNNTATSDGGAMYNTGYAGRSNPILTNCTFLSNSATTAGGALFNDGGGAGQCMPQLTNCIAFGNGGASTFLSVSATLRARYSLFEPLVTGYTSVTGNIISAVSPFVSTTSVQLKNGSPPVNAGDPATTSATVGSTDLAGNLRFYANGRIDIGAYELQEVLEIYSLKNGNWNDQTLWSVERLPQLGERVRLKHLVTIPASYQGLSGTLIYDPASKLMYDTGGRLQLGQ